MGFLNFSRGVLLAICFAAAWCQAAVPPSRHVVVVAEENHSYESVVGNAAMPYLNSLIARYGLATQYYANSHYSIPNYMWLAAGQQVTFNDNTTSVFDVDSIVRRLMLAGKTWKEYAESLPYAGYVGYNVYPYVERHNPFPYFSDVAKSSQKMNIVPFTEFAANVQQGHLPDFSFVTPNLLDDAHSGPLSTADQWLQKNIAPLLATPEFQANGDGILIITFDESFDTDCRPNPVCAPLPGNVGGGRVATVVIGPQVKKGYRSGHFYQHQHVLKTVAAALELQGAPGAAQNATDMGEFFGPGAGSTVSATCKLGSLSPSVTICAPASGSMQHSPVRIEGGARDLTPVNTIQVYVDNVLKEQVRSSIVNIVLPMAAGTHKVTVQSWNTAGQVTKSNSFVTVQ